MESSLFEQAADSGRGARQTTGRQSFNSLRLSPQPRSHARGGEGVRIDPGRIVASLEVATGSQELGHLVQTQVVG